MKITHVDQLCVDLIIHFEGFNPSPYLCPANVPTIGIGTTRYRNGIKVSLSDYPITKEKAIEYLMDDIYQFELAVDTMAIDTITQNQFNALVSFAYNCGSSNLKSSTLLKRVNKNPDDPTIKEAFMMWVKADGKTLKGLVLRRAAEVELYFKK